MVHDYTLVVPGEQMIPLDDAQLAAISGGEEAFIPKIFRELIILAWECVKTGIDDVIAGAEEGYADAQDS